MPQDEELGALCCVVRRANGRAFILDHQSGDRIIRAP
jgi:hypothetical protein